MKKFPRHLAVLAVLAIAFNFLAFAGDTEKVLFNFQGASYGRFPQGFVRDTAGNLYGVLLTGGNPTCSTTCGVVYKVAPNASGQIIETILHTFTNGNDGAQPTNIVMDANGNIFVGAHSGGVTSCYQGCGAIVELSPVKTGGWSTTVLYDFTGGPNGQKPVITLIDPQGNLYGFENGGSYNQIFQLSPSSSGTWTHKTIYRFQGGTDGGDGFPSFMDANGNIFGRATEGGNTACPGGCGLVFELSPSSSGTWTKTNLYSFAGPPDGALPWSIVPDGLGNIFGVTSYGGTGTDSHCQILSPKGCGTLFELSPSSGGGYTETVLHEFNYVLDGWDPIQLLMDSAGNIYVDASAGGVGGSGVVLKFTLDTSDGIWDYSALRSFAGGNGGGFPFQLQLDSVGDVFGVGASGGGKGYGLLFELLPGASN